MARKTRTREHIIADYSGNYFERFALDCGFSVERVFHDYGVDLVMNTYNENGEIENGEVKIQLKATSAPKHLHKTNEISFPIEAADLETWLDELLPVILVLYDAEQEIAYWLHVQNYFAGVDTSEIMSAETKTVRINKANVLNAEAVRLFARLKNETHQRLQRKRRNA